MIQECLKASQVLGQVKKKKKSSQPIHHRHLEIRHEGIYEAAEAGLR
jgi:hypothetical protein